METLNGAICLVTGGGSGIGRAVALALAAEKAEVHICGRSLDKLEKVQKERDDSTLFPHHTDLSNDDEVAALCKELRRHHDRLDLLVHSAGVYAPGEIGDTPVAELDRHYRTNLRAPYFLTRELLPLLRRARGEIVFLNSSAIFAARPSVAAYTASKSGLKALADSLRQEENGRGIRVLSVYPGRTATPMQAEIHAQEEKPYSSELLAQPEDVALAVLGAVSLPRTVEVTDLHLRPFRKS